MKSSLAHREVVSSGTLASGAFGISQENQVDILVILRDTLYTDKILAVLREYSANAWDAHREAGKPDLPIRVVLPTALDSSLIIEDWGPGLSESGIFTVFTQYGASTKRLSNLAVGTLGIGAKSGFSYNDSFSVTSWHGGFKRVFHAVLDESNVGEMLKLHEEALGELFTLYLGPILAELELSFDPGVYYNPLEVFEDILAKVVDPPSLAEAVSVIYPDFVQATEGFVGGRTGIEIKVPVNPGDISAFHQKARGLFRYFRPLPDINAQLSPPTVTLATEHGFLQKSYRHSDDWTAVMGCVPYRLNLSQVLPELKAAGIEKVIDNLQGGLYFDIGDVEIVANREELAYKEKTKAAIVAKFQAVLDDISQELQALFRDKTLSAWEKRLKVQEFQATTNMPLGPAFAEWKFHPGQGVRLYSTEAKKDANGVILKNKSGENLTEAPESFVMKWNSGKTLEESIWIPLRKGVRLLVKDTTQPWRGFLTPGHTERIITIRKGHSVDQVLKDLDVYLERAKLTGIAVLRMSEMEYIPAMKRTGTGYNRKHSEACFELIGTASRSVYSENWAIVDRVPDPDDVYIIISRFISTHADYSWFSQYDADKELLKMFGEEMPTVYGLKTTQDKPVRREDVVGIHYTDWRLRVIQEALDQHPEVWESVEAYLWGVVSPGTFHKPKYQPEVKTVSDTQTFAFLRDNLDGRHRLARFFSDRLRAQKVMNGVNYTKKKRLEHLAETLNLGKDTAARRRLKYILDKYPLLKANTHGNPSGLGIFNGLGVRDHWLQYVKLVDENWEE